MRVNSAPAQPVSITIAAKTNRQNGVYSTIWSGLKDMGYSNAEAMKITSQLDFDPRKIKNGTTVDVTSAIERSQVGFIQNATNPFAMPEFEDDIVAIDDEAEAEDVSTPTTEEELVAEEVPNSVSFKIDARTDRANNTYTNPWTGLKDLGYTDSEVAQILKAKSQETTDGRRFNARRIPNGAIVDFSDVIQNLGLPIKTGTQAATDVTPSPTPTPTPTPIPTPAPIQQGVMMYNGKPINVEPVSLDAATARAKYGNNKFMDVAEKMLSISEENNGERIITGKNYYQPWCADVANYFYRQLLGENPLCKHGNLSSVAGIRSWGIKHNLYHKNTTTDAISKAMPTMNPGDILVFKEPYHVKCSNGKTYLKNNTSHIAVVLGYQNGKLLVLEGNVNDRVKDKNGNFVYDPINTIKTASKYDGVKITEYDVNALCSRGFQGHIDMSGYNQDLLDS